MSTAKKTARSTSKAQHSAKPDSTRFNVVLERSGVRAVGDIIAHQPVRVDAAEAVRLVDTKGLKFVDPSDEGRARAIVQSDNPDAKSGNAATEE